MTSLQHHLDVLDATTITLPQAGPDTTAAAARHWPSLARAAAGALLRVPALDPPDAAGLYQALIGLAQPTPDRHTVVSGHHPLSTMRQAYGQIAVLLEGQPGAHGRDHLHAAALRDRLLGPLHRAASWALASCATLAPDQRTLLDALARHTPPGPRPVTGTRYGDLGAVTTDADQPIDRALARWRDTVTARLTPSRVTTAELRATLADLIITTATAYYLTKTAGAAGRLDPTIAVPAGQTLWEARHEWRAQARSFPRDLRLGSPIDEHRTQAAGALREALADAFQNPATGDWLPAEQLLDRHRPDQLTAFARHLAGTAATIADRHAAAVAALKTRPVQRIDPRYHPVFKVGTDLAKVTKTRWLRVGPGDTELRYHAQRARFAAGLAGYASTLANETALGRPRTPNEQTDHAAADLRALTAALDAAIPPPRRKHGQVHPDLRPAWHDGRIPPESRPDPEPTPTPAAAVDREHDLLTRAAHHAHLAAAPSAAPSSLHR